MGRLISKLEELEEYKGKVVPVRVDMESRLGAFRSMMYAGDFTFIDSLEEKLGGTREFRGLRAVPQHLGEENNKFTIYNMNPPSNISNTVYFSTAAAKEEALLLWEERVRISA